MAKKHYQLAQLNNVRAQTLSLLLLYFAGV